MFYDGAYSRRIVRYDRANVYGSAKILHRSEEICREGSVEKRDHSLTLHFFFVASPPYHGILQNPKSSMLPGRLQITMDCSGKTGWYIIWRNA